MIDPPLPLFDIELFRKSLDFMEQHLKERPVIVHCNKGESRSISLVMLYMAKRTDKPPSSSYEIAYNAFQKVYPYQPSRGIATFLFLNWNKII